MAKRKRRVYVPPGAKNPGDVWVMTGVTPKDFSGNTHPTGDYFNPSEVCDCSYCQGEVKKKALKSSVRTVGAMTTKPMCYPCYMSLVCPEPPIERGDPNKHKGSWGGRGDDEGVHKMRTLKNKHICNNPMGEGKTEWNEFDY